jgi:hypothetical protein
VLSESKVIPHPSQDSIVNELLAALEIHAETLVMQHLRNEFIVTSVEVGRLMNLETMTYEANSENKIMIPSK